VLLRRPDPDRIFLPAPLRRSHPAGSAGRRS
jgi:hypothetical protein